MDSRKTAQQEKPVQSSFTLSTPVKLASAAFTGFLELCVFYGVADTARKRLQRSSEPVILRDQPLSATVRNAMRIVLSDAHDKSSMFEKARSLYRGFPWAVGYKVVQRTFQLGVQPILRNGIDDAIGPWVKEKMGERKGKTFISALAGMGVGALELSLLAPENLKIKFQTDVRYRKLSIPRIIQAEGWYLFKAADITLLRNIPGSALLFGVSAGVSYGMFGLDDPKHGSLWQRAVSSAAGVTASIAGTNPFEVVRTRALASAGKVSVVSIFSDTIKKEGWGALLTKGLVPGVVCSGPKLLFSMLFMHWLQGLLEKESNLNYAASRGPTP